MRPLSSLVKVSGDSDRHALLAMMTASNPDNPWFNGNVAGNVSSYYGQYLHSSELSVQNYQYNWMRLHLQCSQLNLYHLLYTSYIYCKQHTNPNTDQTIVPTVPIYCIDFAYRNLTTAACFVRQGNLLLYPITTSYGWSDSGTGRPKQCTIRAILKNAAAKFYCSKYCCIVCPG